METVAGKKRKRIEIYPDTKLDRATNIFEDNNDYLKPEGSRYCDINEEIQSGPGYSFLVPDSFQDTESDFTDPFSFRTGTFY